MVNAFMSSWFLSHFLRGFCLVFILGLSSMSVDIDSDGDGDGDGLPDNWETAVV